MFDAVVRPSRPSYAVTVLPDPAPGATASCDGGPRRAPGPSLARWATLGRGGPATAVPHVTVLARDPVLVSAGLRALPPALGDFALQRRAAGAPPAQGPIRGSAAAGAAVVAALRNVLRLRGRAPRDCGVVVAGAATMPALRPMLLDAGFGGVTTWDGRPGDRPPLHRLTRDADAVVDLSGCTWELARTARIRSDLVVLAPAPRWPLLALPGLIRAVAAGPPTELDLAVYQACAVALAAAAPPGRALPDPRDPAVAAAVAHAAAAALVPAAASGRHAPVAAAHDGART